MLAERVGFEPTNTFWVLLEFQSSAFDRSATSPWLRRLPDGQGCGNRTVSLPTPQPEAGFVP